LDEIDRLNSADGEALVVVVSADLFKERRASKPVRCPDCGVQKMRRLPRVGFLQQTFWPIFGLYPWECPMCRKMRLVRYRSMARP
jgi:DNA-directed RNA polymerase subunit RPC12/RpoP